MPGFSTGVKEAAQGRPFSLRVPRRKNTRKQERLPGGREINSVYYFSDGEIRKEGARLTPIDGQGVPNAPRSMPVNIWRDARRRAGMANPRVNPGCSTPYDIAARFKTLF